MYRVPNSLEHALIHITGGDVVLYLKAEKKTFLLPPESAALYHYLLSASPEHLVSQERLYSGVSAESELFPTSAVLMAAVGLLLSYGVIEGDDGE